MTYHHDLRRFLLPVCLVAAFAIHLKLSARDASSAAVPETTKLLLDVLVKKGVITQREAADLVSQVQAAAGAPAADPVAAAPSGAMSPNSGKGGVAPTVDVAASPLAFRIGSANFTPLGFMDFTGVFRSTTVGSGVGTSFGSIPYSNTSGTTIGPLSETRFSAQNSRIGLRVDSNVGDAKVLGYTEADFLGNAANNLATVSNSDTLRMRVYFADVTLKSGWEFLAGQDWSLLTPNRKGLSPIPSDIFYTQDVDTNYQVGLIWSRDPQIRAVYHLSPEWTAGLSLENPDQYVGTAVTLPSSNFNTNQLDISSGSNASGTANPNVVPDVIVKIAYDAKLGGGASFHADAAGFIRDFKINTFGAGGALNANSSAVGHGASFNMNIGLTPTFNIIENAYASEGGGRYISTGLGPDFIVGPSDASGAYQIQLERADAGILGFEWATDPMNTLAGYYGAAYYGKDYAQTGATAFLGYGFPGSANSNNRAIGEATLADSYTIWKNPSYGALQLIFQTSYVSRAPWSVTAGAPGDAHTFMFFFDARYTLP
jgi:hypothetical protein